MKDKQKFIGSVLRQYNVAKDVNDDKSMQSKNSISISQTIYLHNCILIDYVHCIEIEIISLDKRLFNCPNSPTLSLSTLESRQHSHSREL